MTDQQTAESMTGRTQSWDARTTPAPGRSLRDLSAHRDPTRRVNARGVVAGPWSDDAKRSRESMRAAR
jgi:hypothetical protein